MFVSLRKHWRHLIPKRRGESLRQIRRFFDCVAALMARHLRDMALASIRSFVEFMDAYSGGDVDPSDSDGGATAAAGQRDEDVIVVPMLSLRLHCVQQKVEFLPSLEQTRDIIVNCLQVTMAL